MTFSILERIDVGETPRRTMPKRTTLGSFSILERIDVGETQCRGREIARGGPFSILERIDVGETTGVWFGYVPDGDFQYPRTDRRG